jgi:hypothetical protein
MTIPYVSASAGVRARDEITKILRRLGCESIGFMDDFQKHEVLLAFKHRGQSVQLLASAKATLAVWSGTGLNEAADAAVERSLEVDARAPGGARGVAGVARCHPR